MIDQERDLQLAQLEAARARKHLRQHLLAQQVREENPEELYLIPSHAERFDLNGLMARGYRSPFAHYRRLKKIQLHWKTRSLAEHDPSLKLIQGFLKNQEQQAAALDAELEAMGRLPEWLVERPPQETEVRAEVPAPALPEVRELPEEEDAEEPIQEVASLAEDEASTLEAEAPEEDEPPSEPMVSPGEALLNSPAFKQRDQLHEMEAHMLHKMTPGLHPHVQEELNGHAPEGLNGHAEEPPQLNGKHSGTDLNGQPKGGYHPVQQPHLPSGLERKHASNECRWCGFVLDHGLDLHEAHCRLNPEKVKHCAWCGKPVKHHKRDYCSQNCKKLAEYKPPDKKPKLNSYGGPDFRYSLGPAESMKFRTIRDDHALHGAGAAMVLRGG